MAHVTVASSSPGREPHPLVLSQVDRSKTQIKKTVPSVATFAHLRWKSESGAMCKLKVK